ncbi:54S ribosomal protein L31, mitochondrial [Schizosaccharomyces pombe]|uniref:Large ribosomal subunit protein mL60 n=1 Tax=Schizosaccharomyces pombe (strain 972 / ATCC 24843) TaxID=284812 RepID=RM31_SCHPO|nr:putative mitochondrial ribosomal protein subunit L31 [Schizosaccharomyces pombe]Q9UR27.1 RecName: Full=Large ribosomal subunit protein mL60; AltName: Full=54S ribosomal protein L31, mitochondrial; AltName: Full=Negative regulator of cdc42 protein nrf20; Flags: Precursor [Schizosaccharomyces pombe 972h-]AAD53228.1 negative regulator of Cdc42p [Schizosaccharomyces pombe]CAB53083.1 mitochondrial ribosomal protein subunit L31 (predicted) [Schizosaccharomyces pombe]|eukprot:NP_587998.1 putative mitochondrial ribosomal protein subunit L31 [Schizosaccharomyces pombe]
MLGAFNSTLARFGGLVHKVPWRLSQRRKYRHRQRLRAVDEVVDVLRTALQEKNQSCKRIESFVANHQPESQMSPKDKYTMFTRKTQGAGLQGFRKGVHKSPKWTRSTNRVNPTGF